MRLPAGWVQPCAQAHQGPRRQVLRCDHLHHPHCSETARDHDLSAWNENKDSSEASDYFQKSQGYQVQDGHSHWDSDEGEDPHGQKDSDEECHWGH